MSRQVVGIVVQQGVINRRELVVPISKVARAGDEVRLDLRASELAGLVELTSPAVSGTPAYIPDPDASERVKEPAIAAAMAVYDNAGQRIGEVESVELDRITLRVGADEVKRLERGVTDKLGTAPAA